MNVFQITANINECLSQPCLNDGTCIDEMNSFICLCADGYRSTLCEGSHMAFFILRDYF